MNKDEKVIDYPDSIDTRVALLEMSISNINDTLKEFKTEMKEMRTEMKEFRTDLKSDLADMRKESRADFRWLLTMMTGLSAVMAHGFHWF